MWLSVLDQSPIPEGHAPGEALQNSIDLARLCDRLGYRRYWVAEHHGTPALACNGPEVLIGPIAGATSRMRVGSGGVMLPHYSPLKVAENFGMLTGLYPGRIDLGIGRAAGTTRAVAHALQRDRRHMPPDDFFEQLNELLGYFGDEKAEASAFHVTTIGRPQFSSPEISILGSSLQSAIWAAELGLPYVFADFINPEGARIAAHYISAFQPSTYAAEPRLSVAVWTVCAPTAEEAEELSLSARMMLTLMMRGKLVAVPTVERARRFLREENLPPQILTAGRRFIAGDPKRIKAALISVSREYDAGELLLVNILHSHQARRRTYELVAKEFNLESDSMPEHSEYSAMTRA